MTQPEEQAEPGLPEPELTELAPADAPAEGRDPSNTDVEELVDPLDDDDDIFGALDPNEAPGPDEPTA